MDNSLRLARLWTTLERVKEELDNTAIQLGFHLSLEGPQLMIALEELSEKITDHFERYRLVAEVCHTKQG